MPLRVTNTALGASTALGARPGFSAEVGEVYIVAIDFEAGADVPRKLSDIDILLRSNAGQTTAGLVQRNPETGGPRPAFSFAPEGADLIEFRAQLRRLGRALSEVWLYRWTRA